MSWLHAVKIQGDLQDAYRTFLVLETNMTELEYLHPDLFLMEEESQENEEENEEEEDENEGMSCIEIHLFYHPLYQTPCCFVRHLSDQSFSKLLPSSSSSSSSSWQLFKFTPYYTYSLLYLLSLSLSLSLSLYYTP